MPFSPTQKGAAALAVVAALGISGSAIAGAATTAKTAQSSTTTTPTTKTKANNNETALTGADLTKASAAAIAANPGATVNRASTEDPDDNNGAAYEVKITKADKNKAEVLLDSSFTVLSTKAQSGLDGHGHGGNPNEKALTGDDLAKATAAAKSAVSGGTVERASTEDSAENTGGAYEVHVTKTDGSQVSVLLDSSFKVIKTVADQGHGGHGH
jgi:uncharacterized membrane protein YkoI